MCEPGCTRVAVDALPMNRLQAVGTHNSYKMAIAPGEMAKVRAANADRAKAWSAEELNPATPPKPPVTN